MIKNWNEFLLVESNNENKGIPDRFKEFDPYKEHYGHPFGIKPNEIEDLFWELDKKYLYLLNKKYLYLDNDLKIRENIKQDEELTPCLRITIKSIRSQESGDKIPHIKSVIKKIQKINKLKSGINFKDIVIIDRNKDDIDEDLFNPYEMALEYDDPFSIIKTKNSSIIYTYGEDDYISSTSLDIFLISDKKVEITPTLFYDFYSLTGGDKIDEKGNIWCDLSFAYVADILFEGDWVDKYFEPTDWDIIYHSYNNEYTISNVVDSISNENKKKLLNFLYEEEGLDKINDILDEPIESLADLLDIDDDVLKELFNDFNIDILTDIINRYDSVMSDKFYEKAENYIKEETLEYLNKYIECDYVTYKDEKEYKEMILICFDPNVFIYSYKDDSDPEDWEGDWGYQLYNSDVEQIIIDGIYEHSKQIRWSDYVGDNIYLYDDDINNYIQDIFDEYGIK